MKNKDLKKLNRKELLELFLPLSKENDELKKENKKLQNKNDIIKSEKKESDLTFVAVDSEEAEVKDRKSVV